MSKKISLIGQTFGKLIVIAQSQSIHCGKATRTTWLCECSCEDKTQLIVRQDCLYKKKSCGCLDQKDLIGKVFGKLTIIARAKPILLFGVNRKAWICECSCLDKKRIIVAENKLLFNSIKSCGCLRRENGIIQAAKLERGKLRIVDRIEANARAAYANYKHMSDNSISFDYFIKISQQNCNYCNCKPQNIGNQADHRSGNEFIYNGLDRVDNNGGHTINNCVPCCPTCNWAKGNMTIDAYFKWIKHIHDEFITKEKIINKNISNIDYTKYINSRYELTSARAIYYTIYSDGNLQFDEFLSLSQMNCFYCAAIPSNISNVFKYNKDCKTETIKNGNFIYSGLDRIDNTKSHNSDNCISCCKQCNKAKSDLSIDQFRQWIIASYNRSILQINQ